MNSIPTLSSARAPLAVSAIPRGKKTAGRPTVRPAGPRSKKIARKSRLETEHENNMRAIDEMARRDVELLRSFFAGERAPEKPFPEGTHGADVLAEEFRVEFRGDEKEER